MMVSDYCTPLACLLLCALSGCCRGAGGAGSSSSLQGEYLVRIAAYPESSATQEDILEELRKITLGLQQLAAGGKPDIDKPIADCSKAYTSGVYTIKSLGLAQNVFCQVDNDGKWTVIQRRQDGSLDFYRNWANYSQGFGDVAGEFWLGNNNIHHLTSTGLTRLRIDLEDWENNTHTVYYDVFKVAGAEAQYKLTVDGFEGTTPPGDSFASHNSYNFTTFDQDHDVYCATLYRGGWWYRQCHGSNLNGFYNNTQYAQGPNWNTFKGYNYALRKTAMMIREP